VEKFSSIVAIDSERLIGDTATQETQYFTCAPEGISSSQAPVADAGCRAFALGHRKPATWGTGLCLSVKTKVAYAKTMPYQCRHYPPCGLEHDQANSKETHECQTYAQDCWLG